MAIGGLETLTDAMTGGGVVLVGKIVWDWLLTKNNPPPKEREPCHLHSGVVVSLEDIKNAISEMRTDIKTLLSRMT